MISNTVTLKQLEALIWVADLGSFRKAAHHLNTTQPNISTRIAALESTLDVILMHRDAGAVRMSAKGQEILDAARQVLRETENVLAAAQRSDLISDRLRLGVTELVACTWLHDFLRKLKQVYPGLSVELTVDLSHSLDQDIRNHAFDLTLQNAPFQGSIGGEVALHDAPYVWVAAKTLGVNPTTKHTVASLLPFTILTHARHTQAFEELHAHAETHALPVGRFVPSNSLSACVQMAKDGLGVALLPKALVATKIAAGSLFHLDVDWLPSPLQFSARYHGKKAASHVQDAAMLAQGISRNFT
jgi:DNA-binding transcriptional LysR family regulator